MLLAILAVPPNAGAAARTIEIEAGTRPDGSMYLAPDDVTVDLGDVVTIRVRNPDPVFHDVAILSYGGEDIEIEVPKYKTEERTFTANTAGDFRMVCEVSGHKQKGMQGMIHIVDPAAKKVPAVGIVLSVGLLALLALVRPHRSA